MATSKKSTNRTVTNKGVSFKNGKNAQAESLMKRSFEPLFSPKDSKARLTFCGVEHSIIEWQKNGKNHEKPIMKLVFSCLDVTHEMPVNIAVTCEYRLSQKNKLGQILNLMGFVVTDETEVIDEDDEFGIKTKQANPTEIFDFLRGQCGLVFKGNLQRPTKKDKVTGERYELKGLWEIVPDSLEPFMKNGKQLRDMLASDVSDDAFENPEINMESEAG